MNIYFTSDWMDAEIAIMQGRGYREVWKSKRVTFL